MSLSCKVLLLVIGLMGSTCLSVKVFAQAKKTDSLFVRYDSLAKAKGKKLDSVSNRSNAKIDSVQQRINAFASPDINSLRTVLAQKHRSKKDSTKDAGKLDSLRQKLQHRIDSLKRLGKPTDQFTRQLDSLKGIAPIAYATNAEARAREVTDKIDKPINNLEGKVNEKLSLMNQEGGAGSNLPGSATLPGVSNVAEGSIPALDLPGSDLKIDNPLQNFDNPLQDKMEGVADLKQDAAKIKGMPQEKLGELKSVEEVSQISGKLSEANELTDKAQAYQGDLKNVAQGELGEVKQLPEALEGQAKRLEEVQALEKQTGEMNKYQNLVGKGNDPEALKGLAKDQALTQAKDHFAGKEVVLMEAIEKLNKLKIKYPSFSSLSEIPKGRVINAMRGKPLRERLIPGLTFQIQKASNVLLDVNPVISYRISGRWNAGLGWNERFSFTKWNKLKGEDRIFGPRIFSTVLLVKGFSMKAEVEKMNTLIPAFPGATDLTHRAWVWSAFVGLTKSYVFVKNVRGNFQFLYNVYDDHYNSPYLDRLNVRFGFEFQLRNKKKSD